jgi:putative transposase
LFGVTRQAYYKAMKRTGDTTEQDRVNREVIALAKQERKKLQKVGTRKIHFLIKEELKLRGIEIGRDKLYKLLREAGMLIPKKRFRKVTDSKHPFRKYKNLINDLEITHPEQVWVSDITYICLYKGFCYLSMITDSYSRKIVGYDLSESMAVDGVLRALTMALDNRCYQTELIHHSDKGSQYCALEYTGKLIENDIRISMTEQADPYENALAERMNRTIKEEFIVVEKLPDILVARQLIDESIRLYNEYRPHLSCDMRTPASRHNFFIEVTKEITNYINNN